MRRADFGTNLWAYCCADFVDIQSIDLTRLPASPIAAQDSVTNGNNVEYSSREVKPSALLLQDLLRAHSVFLLHHDSSLSSLFTRSKRAKFVSLLGRYWDLFLPTWNVLLHGNPVCNVFGGIKVASSGELGVGVGEEDRGSGEREVLEGLVGRIEGLVDLVVSKFGSVDPDSSSKGEPGKMKEAAGLEEAWLGTGKEPGADDGAVFLGVGTLSRTSLRDLTYWMEDLYIWGENAYGVQDSPESTRALRRSKKPAVVEPTFMQPPPPIVGPRHDPAPALNPPNQEPASSKTAKTGTKIQGKPAAVAGAQPTSDEKHGETGGRDRALNYLKLGYGTYWTLGGSASTQESSHAKDGSSSSTVISPKPSDSDGHYLIGLMGDVEEEYVDPDERFADVPGGDYSSRTLLRTVIVECEGLDHPESRVTGGLGSTDREVTQEKADEDGTVMEQASTPFDSQDRNKSKELRVVVYVNKPFIFTFLFQLRTDSLAWDGLYKSLHHQLAPLRKPLLSSTAYRPGRPDAGTAAAASSGQIYDLIWDRKALTIHSTIPNIPEPGIGTAPGSNDVQVWSRVEALNTHTQILNTFAATREDLSELERTCKTSRGWWVVWSRILEREAGPPRPPRPPQRDPDEASSPVASHDSEGDNSFSSAGSGDGREKGREDDEGEYTVSKEIFLLRKASDNSAGGGVFGHARAASGSGALSYAARGGWADGASRLAQGIGVDTRKYIEGLLRLDR